MSRNSGQVHEKSTEWATVAEMQTGRTVRAYLQFVSRERKTTAKGAPYFQCAFRDKTGRTESKAWESTDLYRWCQEWTPGEALEVVCTLKQNDPKYSPLLEIHEVVRVAESPESNADFEWSLLIETSQWPPEKLREKIFELLEKHVADRQLVQLCHVLIEENWGVLATLPAAARMHHAMQTGWLEHIWSMTRLAAVIGQHYSRYYGDLDPPLQTDILIVGAVLHDLGKAIELACENHGEATYTTPGRLLGHIVMGRDMIREAASQLDPPLDGETLLRLEHAVLAHHGRTDFGSPVVPQTLEAFLLAEIDDMDAKVNSVVKALRNAQAGSESRTDAPSGLWTERVSSCDPSRTFYRGFAPRATNVVEPDSPNHRAEHDAETAE